MKDLFKDLLLNLDSKKILLNKLLANEKSASDLIKYRNDAEDDLLSITEISADLIAEINIADYNTAQIKDELIRRYHFDFDKIFRKEYRTSDTEIVRYKNEILSHSKILEEIVILKKQNNLSMENFQKDLAIQISELERMGKLKILIPKDPRSF